MIDVINKAINQKLKSISWTNVIEGVVLSLDPLSIDIGSNLHIGLDFIDRKSLGIAEDNQSPDPAQYPFIVGDRLYFIRYNNAQRYYALIQSGGSGTVNYNELENKPALNTDNTNSLPINNNETILGSINLHKVAKTGLYTDLRDIPNLSIYATKQQLNEAIFIVNETIWGLESIYYKKSGGLINGQVQMDIPSNSTYNPQITLMEDGVTRGTIRSETNGHLLLAGTGGSIFLRPNGNSNSSNQLQLPSDPDTAGIIPKSLLMAIYPVGSIIITPTNANPQTRLGGTWTLVFKKCMDRNANSGIIINSTNTSSYNATWNMHNNVLSMAVSLVNKTVWADSTLTVGTLDMATIGITRLGETFYPISASDGNNVVAQLYIHYSSGTIENRDATLGRSGTAGAAIGSSLAFQFASSLNWQWINDNVCDEWHWKRTA